MRFCFILCLISLSTVAGSQEPRKVLSQPMPQDRADNAYAIYSKLLSTNQIEWQNAPRTQWLIEDSTTKNPAGDPCRPLHGEGPLNPHDAVKSPPGRESDLRDLLDDFDLHCHESIQLKAAKFKTSLPVRTIGSGEQAEFQTAILASERSETGASLMPASFQGAAGTHRFSEVYFNPSHTLALTEFGIWCGSLCGNQTWVVLEKLNGKWEVLPWTYIARVS